MPIPAGIIAIWRGTIANIPAGWDLCDGNGGRPNLLGKFLRSVPALTDPGGEGGSDTHTHADTAGAVGAHDHGALSGTGDHTHSSPTVQVSHPGSAHGTVTRYLDGPTYIGSGGNIGGGRHNHSWSRVPSEHTHAIDSQGAHSHTLQNADTRPAYYQVAFIYSDGTLGKFAEGIITFWSDVLGNIPAGWSLDTTLVAKFLRGVPAATDPGGTGGSDSHAHTQNASGAHTHALAAGGAGTHNHNPSSSAGSHTHGAEVDYGYAGGAQVGQYSSSGSHSHSSGNATPAAHGHTAASPGTHSHTINTEDGRPPYYELAPIKAGAAGAGAKIGTICIWTGTIANIPAGWELCDGNGSGPNLLGKFIRGVATAGTNPGGTGGNLTHTHTVQAGGDHTHTIDSQGTAHTHSGYSSTWSHRHGYYSCGDTDIGRQGYNLYGPSHNHGTLTSAGAHDNHSITALGTHVLHTYDVASSLPVYYEVAFIYSLVAPWSHKINGIFPSKINGMSVNDIVKVNGIPA